MKFAIVVFLGSYGEHDAYLTLADEPDQSGGANEALQATADYFCIGARSGPTPEMSTGFYLFWDPAPDHPDHGMGATGWVWLKGRENSRLYFDFDRLRKPCPKTCYPPGEAIRLAPLCRGSAGPLRR